MAKTFLYKNSNATILPRIRKFKLFSKGINPKVKVIMRLGFELAYYTVIVQHVRHYTESLPLKKT